MTARSVFRLSLWFATAYTLVIIVHETAHALTASALGLEATLFHFWANIDSAHRAAVTERSLYGAAGPAASLLLGIAAWFTYRHQTIRESAAAMPLLYLAAFGIANFFGNLMSAAFVGDFSNLANRLGMPRGARYALSCLGATVLMGVLFAAGRQLARWGTPGASRAMTAFRVVALPALSGTALIILVNQPVPIPGFTFARMAEGAFWLFAFAGAFTSAAPPIQKDAGLRLRWQDGAIAMLVFAAVRVMSRGIPLGSG